MYFVQKRLKNTNKRLTLASEKLEALYLFTLPFWDHKPDTFLIIFFLKHAKKGKSVVSFHRKRQKKAEEQR